MSACWPPVALAVPRPACAPQWYCDVGIHMGAQVSGPPRKMPCWAFHCPLGGLFSWCWVDRPRVPGTSEGSKARGWAGRALGPGQAPTVSSEQQARGRTPAICRPGGLALGLWPREEMAAGQAQDGVREGRRGRERPGAPGRASSSRRLPLGSWWQGWPVAQVCACVRVCACACMCPHVRTHPRAGLGALSTHPGAQVNRFPTRNTAGTGGQDLMR